jgi:hypothetical protein
MSNGASQLLKWQAGLTAFFGAFAGVFLAASANAAL